MSEAVRLMHRERLKAYREAVGEERLDHLSRLHDRLTLRLRLKQTESWPKHDKRSRLNAGGGTRSRSSNCCGRSTSPPLQMSVMAMHHSQVRNPASRIRW
jgi:hypothetical protein